MSLYRFKSRETGDLVMLQPSGKRILEVLGKDLEGPGILLASEMPVAMEALRAASAAEEAEHERLKAEALANGDPEPALDVVSLRMRAAPLIEMSSSLVCSPCPVWAACRWSWASRSGRWARFFVISRRNNPHSELRVTSSGDGNPEQSDALTQARVSSVNLSSSARKSEIRFSCSAETNVRMTCSLSTTALSHHRQ